MFETKVMLVGVGEKSAFLEGQNRAKQDIKARKIFSPTELPKQVNVEELTLRIAQQAGYILTYFAMSPGS